MGDWNEWNDLQETADMFDPTKTESTQATKKNKEMLTEILNEPNKYVYKKKVDKVNKKITMYSSGGYGNYIVNPLDNTQYNIKVGSKEESKFFSVRFTSKMFPGKDNDSITLYYDSPYTYERHHHVSLPQHILQNWDNKQRTRKPTNPLHEISETNTSTDTGITSTHQEEEQQYIQVK